MNEENQQNEMSEIEKSERQAKQAGKDVARKSGKILGDFAKKGLKALIRAIGIKGIAIVITNIYFRNSIICFYCIIIFYSIFIYTSS